MCRNIRSHKILLWSKRDGKTVNAGVNFQSASGVSNKVLVPDTNSFGLVVDLVVANWKPRNECNEIHNEVENRMKYLAVLQIQRSAKRTHTLLHAYVRYTQTMARNSISASFILRICCKRNSIKLDFDCKKSKRPRHLLCQSQDRFEVHQNCCLANYYVKEITHQFGLSENGQNVISIGAM